jgi:hypothetical protein
VCPERGRGRGDVAENCNTSIESNEEYTREINIHLRDHDQGVLGSCEERSEEVC